MLVFDPWIDNLDRDNDGNLLAAEDARRIAVRYPYKAQVDAALRAARHAGDVLRNLAEHDPWSFHVAPPQPVSISARDAAAVPTVEGGAEKHVLLAFSRTIRPTPATKGGRAVRGASARPAAVMPAEVPPAWMLPTILWHLPPGDRG